jgi:cell division septum initiation protein DivIVA
MNEADLTGEIETLTRLHADEAALDRRLAEARAHAAAIIEGAHTAAARLRAAAEADLAGELAAVREAEERRREEEGATGTSRRAGLVTEARRRAEANQERALALLLGVVASEGDP